MPQDLRVPMAPVLEAFGVPITVTRPLPDDGPINTTGVWLPPLFEAQPSGTDLKRREARKVMSMTRDLTLTQVPRGTVILAPETLGGPVRTWRVDSYDRPVEPDEFRVNLVPISEVI